MEAFFFAVSLPFTCDFGIYSSCFKTTRHEAVFGGMGVRIYPKRIDAPFGPRGPNGAVSGPVKLKSNSMGIFAVSVRRFPRWLMGSKESRRLNENVYPEEKPRCTAVYRHVSHRVIYSPGTPEMPWLAMGSKNSAYAGARGARRLVWRPDSFALAANSSRKAVRQMRKPVKT